jgi:hypothetical protein
MCNPTIPFSSPPPLFKTSLFDLINVLATYGFLNFSGKIIHHKAVVSAIIGMIILKRPEQRQCLSTEGANHLGMDGGIINIHTALNSFNVYQEMAAQSFIRNSN